METRNAIFFILKLKIVALYFPNKIVTINYVSIACKNVTYNIIKYQSNRLINFYWIVNELIYDLNNIFNKYNEFIINFNELVNKNFKISYKDFNKTFNSYLVKFITIVVSLNFSYNI